MGLWAILDGCGKSDFTKGCDPHTVQPAASRSGVIKAHIEFLHLWTAHYSKLVRAIIMRMSLEIHIDISSMYISPISYISNHMEQVTLALITYLGIPLLMG